MNSLKKRIKITLLLILLVGLLFRLYHLGKESVIVDEALTAQNSAIAIPELTAYWFSVGHFPTYFLMMHYWIKLFGPGEFALRFPSVIFGVLSIYLVFLLGKRLFDKKTSLLASYLFAASTASIYYSQYARPYSMVVCFVLLSFLSFFRALKKNTLCSWAWYAVVTLFTLLLSASTLPILICQALFLAIAWPHYRGRISPKRAAAAFLLITITYLPLLLKVFVPNIENGKVRPLSWLPLPSLGTVVNIFDIFGGKLIIDDVAYAPDSGLSLLKGVFGAILFLLCLLGVFSAFKAGKREPNLASTAVFPLSGVFLSLWLIISLVLPVAFSYFFSPVFGEVRYVLYLSAPYYLLISRGIMHFKKKTLIFVFVCIFLAGLLFLREYYRVEKRTNWRQICSYIKNNIKSDEKTAFIVNNSIPISYAEHTMLTYYSALPIIGIRTTQPSGMSEDRLREYEDVLRTIQTHTPEDISYKGIWLVTWTPPGKTELHKKIIRKLQERYSLIESTVAKTASFITVSLYHFRTKGQ